MRQIQERTTTALQQYFNSRGVYVLAEDLADAVTLEEHQELLENLSREFEVTTKAIRLAVDIGSISLAEKEKAMLALYEIEKKCAEHQGDRGELEGATASLLNKVLAWPKSPVFTGSFLVSLLGCFFLFIKNFSLGLVLLVFATSYGVFQLASFEKKKAQLAVETADANARFDSLVTGEISPRPALPVDSENVRFRALAFVGIMAAVAIAALVYRPHDAEKVAASPTEKVSQTNIVALPATTANSAQIRRSPADLTWLAGKYPSDVVNDRRFRAAFNHVPQGEWKKIADRLVITNSAGIQLKDGYYFGEGCKAHLCGSDKAAFAINAATGKGDVIYKQTVGCPSGKAVANGFAWNDMSIGSTPLSAWALSNDMTIEASSASASEPTSGVTLQTSFNCAKARSDAEHLICQDAELAADDVELAATFAKAKAAVTDQAALRERTRREWNFREQSCHDRNCLVRWYADQKTVLTQIAQTGNVEAN
ncbi:lysozyme inhibitor LprI family protein [Caballeronia mineralivorans]|uniref:lysozyme inhibitor LprI family protein n=1 Tax=Caballeronia mineralivorans TaxID=2010198 RepID=UPI0009E3253B|nr:hypothetical protein [Caballeronia mineralivorans]